MSEKTQTYASGPDRHPSGPPGTVRPLGRSRTDRKVAGVAGGLGAYLDIDPVILRVLFVVLAIFGGSGLLLYLVGWLLIPEEGAEHSEMQRFVDRSGTAALVILGVVVAVLLIASSQALGWWGFGSGAWPLLVVAAILFTIGVAGIILNRKNIIVILMSVELILLSVNLNFVAFSQSLGDLVGQVFALFVLTVAAAEAAIGLAILVAFYLNRGTIAVEDINSLKG